MCTTTSTKSRRIQLPGVSPSTLSGRTFLDRRDSRMKSETACACRADWAVPITK